MSAPPADLPRTTARVKLLGSRAALSLGALGLGTLGALVPALLGPGAVPQASPSPSRHAPYLWACDRDAGLVLHLDRDLFVVAERRLPRPVRVAPTTDGGAWVACALEGRPNGAHRLVHLDRELRAEAQLELGTLLGLVAKESGEALVLEAPQEGAERVLEVGPEGNSRVLFECPGARALAVSGSRIAVGDRLGRLELWGPRGERSSVQLPAGLGPLAPAHEGWWVVAQDGTRLVRLTHAGSLVAATELDPSELRLAPCPSDGLWSSGAGVLERRGPDGERISRLEVPNPALGSGPILALESGQVLIAGPGALLELGPGGRPRVGQGGFSGLVDLARGIEAGGAAPVRTHPRGEAAGGTGTPEPPESWHPP